MSCRYLIAVILSAVWVEWHEDGQGLLQNIPVPLAILSSLLLEASTPKKRDAIDGNVLYI